MAAIGFLVVMVIFLTVLIKFLLSYYKRKQIVDKIHGPRTFPFIGNVFQLVKDPEQFFEISQGCTKLYTNPYMYRVWLATEPMVFIHGANEAEVIFSSNKLINKSGEYTQLQPWLGFGLLTSYAEKWRPRRKLLTPTFHYDILKDFIEVFNNEGKVLLFKMKESAEKSDDVDVFPLVTLCALDIICDSAMGQNVNAQGKGDSEYVTAIKEINELICERQKTPWMWFNPIYRAFGDGKRHDYCLNVIHSFTQMVIRERMAEHKAVGGIEKLLNSKESKPRLAFLDLLLNMADKDQIDLNGIREEVDTFMFEGHDTTAAGMTWVLQAVGERPDILAKIHDEVDAVFGDDDRDVSVDDLKKLTYLECVIKEALRLFPSVPMFGRQTDEEITIAGFKIPEDTRIIISPYAIHRDPRHWKEAEVFDPDRFLPENTAGRHPYAYVPFSAGARNCIGQRFALLEEKTVLAWVFRYFDISSIKRRDQIHVEAKLILRPRNGIHSKLTLRKPLTFTVERKDQSLTKYLKAKEDAGTGQKFTYI